MKLMRLVYCSQPFGYSLEILSAILVASRAKNRKNDITGALICRSDIFLQLLEGPVQNVKNTYEAIQNDDRHINVYHLIDRPVKKRLFPAWAMKDDPVKTWMWSREDVSKGIVKGLSKAEVEEVFVKLSQEATIFNF
ncbi:BLUF domain-containing protein [Paracoccaceae bacterium]|nr:BLUF domain-containing protein [Paracoccaceae bacterium]